MLIVPFLPSKAGARFIICDAGGSFTKIAAYDVKGTSEGDSRLNYVHTHCGSQISNQMGYDLLNFILRRPHRRGCRC